VSARADVKRAASALEARIQGVLAGEIHGDPVPLPREARKDDRAGRGGLRRAGSETADAASGRLPCRDVNRRRGVQAAGRGALFPARVQPPW
jgi:hypothetical protein